MCMVVTSYKDSIVATCILPIQTSIILIQTTCSAESNIEIFGYSNIRLLFLFECIFWYSIIHLMFAHVQLLRKLNGSGGVSCFMLLVF